MDDNEKPSFFKASLYGTTNTVLFVAGAVNLWVGTVAAINDSTTVAATSLTAGLVLLFAATIDRFESLKGLGVEAKTRKLDRKIKQADDALRKLRQLAEITGEALVELNSKIGRLSVSPTAAENLALSDSVRTVMEGLGSSKETIVRALAPWARVTCFDLTMSFGVQLQKMVKEGLAAVEAERRQIRQPMDPNDPNLLRLNAEAAKGNEYLGRLRNLYKTELENYPERLMSLFDDVPYVQAERLAPLREKASIFAADMGILSRTLILPNPEAWLRELDEARARQESGHF